MTSQIATCLCPIFKNPSSDVCGICIQTGPESNSSSTALFVKLKTDCAVSNQAVQTELLQLFSISIPNVVGNNSASSADTPTKKSNSYQVSLSWICVLIVSLVVYLVI